MKIDYIDFNKMRMSEKYKKRLMDKQYYYSIKLLIKELKPFNKDSFIYKYKDQYRCFFNSYFFMDENIKVRNYLLNCSRYSKYKKFLEF